MPILYSYIKKNSITPLNGWNILSKDDDQNYAVDANNFVVVNAESIFKLAPVILEIFDGPYGTDLYWQYENEVLTGFYDLVKECDTDINRILHK